MKSEAEKTTQDHVNAWQAFGAYMRGETVYRIYYSGNKYADYATMETAMRIASEIFDKTGIVVGIEPITK